MFNYLGPNVRRKLLDEGKLIRVNEAGGKL